MSLIRVLLGVIVLSLLLARSVSGLNAPPANPVYAAITWQGSSL
jgi:hypothetical protein